MNEGPTLDRVYYSFSDEKASMEKGAAPDACPYVSPRLFPLKPPVTGQFKVVDVGGDLAPWAVTQTNVEQIKSYWLPPVTCGCQTSLDMSGGGVPGSVFGAIAQPLATEPNEW